MGTLHAELQFKSIVKEVMDPQTLHSLFYGFRITWLQMVCPHSLHLLVICSADGARSESISSYDHHLPSFPIILYFLYQKGWYHYAGLSKSCIIVDMFFLLCCSSNLGDWLDNTVFIQWPKMFLFFEYEDIIWLVWTFPFWEIHRTYGHLVCKIGFFFSITSAFHYNFTTS